MYLGTVGIVLPPYRPFTQFETINFYIFHIIFALFVCSFIKVLFTIHLVIKN